MLKTFRYSRGGKKACRFVFALLFVIVSPLLNTTVANAQDCPGVPPGKEFGLTVGDILNNETLLAGLTAYIEGNYLEAENKLTEVLRNTDEGPSENNVRTFAASALYSTLCIQGKHEEAARISKKYDFP